MIKPEFIEKMCRDICRHNYMMDPDDMVFTSMPQMISNMGHLTIGAFVPNKSYQMPAWQLFKKDVEIVLGRLERDGYLK